MFNMFFKVGQIKICLIFIMITSNSIENNLNYLEYVKQFFFYYYYCDNECELKFYLISKYVDLFDFAV